MKSLVFKSVRCACVCGALLLGLAMPPQALAVQEERFATPEEAVRALTAAVGTKDTNALDAIFGPELHSLVSADAVQASNRFAIFARRISEKVALARPSDDRVILEIGNDAWPFPVPLVRRDGQWSFDTEAGKEEILNRRIGMNELGTIRVCHAYVQAQHEYASEAHDGDEVLQYAQYLRSNPGKHDGLYWHAAEGDEVSPFGPLIAAARGEGYHKESKIMNGVQAPYHGYYFKILTRQGRHAPGEKYNYIINGRMIAGFALVAWPAQWGNSGVMTFIVNQQGGVYEKCLGPKTAKVAGAMTTYDPDPTWKLTREP
jgi:hypothetical protein